MSISGVQEKVSLKLSPDRSRLEIAEKGGQFILKPEPTSYPSLPLNEHLTMLLASLVGILTPPLGLIPLNDESRAFIIKRFDRLDDGTKLASEDFCQLAGIRVRDKYDGSLELCVRLLLKHATEPLVEINKLFQHALFGWWTGNGDMHLKNLSLMTHTDGTRKLTPAYDLVCTRLLIPDDEMALRMLGKRKEIRRKNWIAFGKYCKLPERTVERLVRSQVDALEPAIELIQSSFLDDEQKSNYAKILRKNTAVLAKE